MSADEAPGMLLADLTGRPACPACGGPMDARSLELADEFADNMVPCLWCYYEHHTGKRHPTQADLPAGWELEEWRTP